MITEYEEMHLIRPRLFLGSAEDRHRQSTNHASPITAFLCLVGHPEYYNFSYAPHQIVVTYPIVDGYGNTQKQFDECVMFLEQLMNTGHVVLIHCAQGISRSTTVLATYLAKKEDKKFFTVVEEIKQIRTFVNPNPDLVVLAREYLKEVPITK